MKKQILTIAAISGLAMGAFAQGSINIDAALSSGVGITTQDANAANPNTATTWYDGNISLSIWYISSATAGQLSAINAFQNQTGGYSSALALLTGDGFTQVSSTVSGDISDGTVNFAQGTINLTGVPTSSNGFLALVATATGGGASSSTLNGFAGILAFANNVGGNPSTVPPGTSASLTGWNTLGNNFVLSANAVPEPATMAMAALGGISLLALRRKK
jgi:hypothetical protein